MAHSPLSRKGAGFAGLRIGLTYDLRDHYLSLGYSEEETAELDSSVTVEALADALSTLGYLPDFIGNADELARRLTGGERWDLVFNIAEGLHGPGREALVPALLDAYRIPYTFSDPCVMALSLHKGFTKSVLRDAGLHTAGFALVGEATDIRSVSLRYPLFAKPVAEGTGKGIDASSRITSPLELESRCTELLQHYRQPVLVEEYLPGREFTVALLGTGAATEVLGTLEITIRDRDEAAVYSYHNKENYEELVDYGMPDDEDSRKAEELALDAWRVLGCRDAGRVDLRLDAQGRPAIIELNPLAGLHPIRSDLPIIATRKGMSYQELVRRIVESASQRIEPQVRRAQRLNAAAE